MRRLSGWGEGWTWKNKNSWRARVGVYVMRARGEVHLFGRVSENNLHFFVGSLLLFQKRTCRLISLHVFLSSVAKVVAFLSFSLYCVRRIFQFKGCESIFVVFFSLKLAGCLWRLYLCIVFMVLDLRLKEDWLSGDNQFLFYTYRILCSSCRTNRYCFCRSFLISHSFHLQ